MEWWMEIRRRVLVEGVSKREILRETGMHWQTLERVLRAGALTRDAVAQFLFPPEDWRQTTFRLDGREHLRQVKVERTEVSRYRELLAA